MTEKRKIVVIGTGYVGLPAALMWARAGHETVGVDVNENLVKAINDETLMVSEGELQELLNAPAVRSNLRATTRPIAGDVFVIAVPTPVDPSRKVADLSAVMAAVDSIAPVLQRGNLVIVESTIPPLSCRDIIAPRLRELTGFDVPGELMLAHCPERILPGDIFTEIVHNDRLVGGMDEASSLIAAEVYASFVKGELHRTNDLVAELSKLVENTYRDVNVALANELSAICASLGASAYEVLKYANKHPRVNVLSPGIGVGGHCIPVDPWFLKEVAPYDSRLITAARMINDEMPTRVASRIRRAVADLASPKIVALGATYKRNCEDRREAPATVIVDLLRADGYTVRHLDPLVAETDYDSLEAELSGADLVAVLVGHDKLVSDLVLLKPRLSNIMRTPRVVNFDHSVASEVPTCL